MNNLKTRNDTQQLDIFVASHLHNADVIWHCVPKAVQLKLLSFFSSPRLMGKSYTTSVMNATWRIFAHVSGAHKLPAEELERQSRVLEDSRDLPAGGTKLYMINCIAIAYAASNNALTEKQMQVLIPRIVDRGHYDYLNTKPTGKSYIEYILARVARASLQA